MSFSRSFVIASMISALPVALSAVAVAQTPIPTLSVSARPLSFQGSWTYRSFTNDASPSTSPNDLLFGIADLDVREAADGTISGTIGGSGWSLTLSGQATYGSAADTVRVEGAGDVNGEHWVYDYFGYLLPEWSNGVSQVPAIVGTVVRTVPHNNGQATAGVVASFLAVKAK